MEASFRECVNEERRDGRAILLSSHIRAEAEALSDRVTIIREGRAVETGTLAEMRHLTRTLVEADLVGPAALEGIAGVHELTVTGSQVRCHSSASPQPNPDRRCGRAGSRLDLRL